MGCINYIVRKMEPKIKLDDEVRFNYVGKPLRDNESLGGKVVEIVNFGDGFRIDLKRYEGLEVKESFGNTYVQSVLMENVVVKK